MTCILDKLVVVYTQFITENNLPLISADELLVEEIELTAYQINFLQQFIVLWDIEKMGE
jgi:hypothetical protein